MSSSHAPRLVLGARSTKRIRLLLCLQEIHCLDGETDIQTSHCQAGSDYILNMCTCSVVSYCLQLHHCGPPASSVHGISQARILEWAAVSFSRGSSWPKPIKPASPALQADSLPLSHWGRPILYLQKREIAQTQGIWGSVFRGSCQRKDSSFLRCISKPDPFPRPILHPYPSLSFPLISTQYLFHFSGRLNTNLKLREL